MAWDSKSLEPQSEMSPFIVAQRVRRSERFADPLAASSAFAAREDFVFPEQEWSSEQAPTGPEEEGDTPKESTDTTAFLKTVADEALKWGFLPANVATAIKNGKRDEAALTDMLFSARHHELPAGYKIKPTDTALREDWQRLKATVVHAVMTSPTDGVVVAPPFVRPSAPVITPDAHLRDCIKPHIPATLHVSLMDLTDPHDLVCAGIDDTHTDFAASLAKVIAMYAAFELRARVRDALKTVPTSVSVVGAAAAIERAWQPQLDAKKPAGSAAFKGFPKLTRIFKIEKAGKGWKVEFQSLGDITTIPKKAREHANSGTLEGKFGFRQLMALMVTYSNDEASARCISALSYEYINALLVNAGLYVPGAGGLWLGAPYQHKAGLDADRDRLWMPEPTMSETNSSRRFQVGTAKGFATIFAWIALGALVDPGSSGEMVDLLDTGIADYIKLALDGDSRHVTLSRTKIGLIPDPYYWSQTSLIERQVSGKKIRYVMSILNGGDGLPADSTFMSPMDECIVQRHTHP